MAKDKYCSDKCCGSDVKAEDCTCPPTCKHCNCNAVSEGLGDMAHMVERDHEVQMARAELYKIAKYAVKLHDMLKGVSEAEGIEGWMQSKITKAADYIGSVYHTLEYDMVSGGESKKTFKSTMSEADATAYKSALAERMAQKKTELSELGPDTLYKYWNKAYDDVSDPDGKDPEKLKKRRAFMKKAAAQHNKKKGWERPQGAKKSAGDASKSAAALAKHLAKKHMRKDKEEVEEKSQFEIYRNSIVLYDPASMEVKKTYPLDHTHQARDDAKKLGLIATNGAKYMELVRDKKRMAAQDTEKQAELPRAENIEEKAKSKAQQKFMGMVHAMQKGEKVKGASPELKKAAKSMPKKAAKDYAQTKHKGKPEHVKKK